MDSLFQAYVDCRRNKRNTLNVLAFEADYESNLIALCDEINSGLYQPGRSIAFVIQKPVKREIFAASFRDRVVHHWLINRLNPFFEKAFIYDSYASRKGRGAHLGIKRADRFIRQCFDHYVKHDLGLKYYGRYVDDFILVHEDKAYLTSLIPLFSQFLGDKLRLDLHPRKMHLQHYSKGVNFLGVVIKPTFRT